MNRRPPRSTLTAPLFPYPTLFRSGDGFLRRQEAVAEIESTRRLAIAGTLTALVLAAMIAFLLVRQILGPVAAGSTVARRIAEGDLDVDVPEIGRAHRLNSSH